MKFIQTLYIDASKDPFRDSFGWAAPEYHLMGWALSCLQLYKIYGNIALFANSKASHLLTDTLQLPYNEVHHSPDKLTLIHPDLWALPKIYTYSLQEQPFLHIDGDVFIFKKFTPKLLNGELIAQNLEVATEEHYTTNQKHLMRHFSFFPPCVKKDFESGIPIQACNAGIIGGNDMSFFRDYTTMAFEYVNRNADCLKHVNVNCFNVFFEQHLFYTFANEKGLDVSVLFEEIIEDTGYNNFSDFHDVPFNRSYLHLIGPYKRDEFICIQMAAKLRELYPDYYDRIAALFFKKNIRLSPNGFVNPFFLNDKRSSIELKKRLDEQANTHLQKLKQAADSCPPDIEKEIFQNDFDTFYSQLISFLKSDIYKKYDLDKRDIEAQHWYRYLFSDMSAILNQVVVYCPLTKIIESSFNWAGLLNRHYRIAVKYYSNLQVYKGLFYNLVVLEASDNKFSLYDINELDQAILLLLSEPLSISEVLIKMQVYFEDDVLQNHYEDYKNLIITSIKQLVIKKAIQPESVKN